MTIQGAGDLGGLIGRITTGTVSESFATGRGVGTGANVGGLIGLDSGSTLSNSYASGAVQGGSQVGGLEGSTAGSVSYSLSTGTVSGGTAAGGLIGAVTGSGNATSSFWDTMAAVLAPAPPVRVKSPPPLRSRVDLYRLELFVDMELAVLRQLSHLAIGSFGFVKDIKRL